MHHNAWEGMVQARIAGQADESPVQCKEGRQHAHTVVLWELDMGSVLWKADVAVSIHTGSMAAHITLTEP